MLIFQELFLNGLICTVAPISSSFSVFMKIVVRDSATVILILLENIYVSYVTNYYRVCGCYRKNMIQEVSKGLSYLVIILDHSFDLITVTSAVKALDEALAIIMLSSHT